jgi:NAD(P)-dependent dehydrogenase (short-subunit alcohol dehydrogenase family)
VLGLTRSLAVETARSGVTVNAICPGYVNTELTRENARRLAEKRGQSLEEALAMMAASSPQRRLIEPEEVAFVALMLASERARGITGQGIQVDGGAVMDLKCEASRIARENKRDGLFEFCFVSRTTTASQRSVSTIRKGSTR